MHTCLPQDSLQLLARSRSLPERTQGAALFADIAGFTALTESLTQQHGERGGIEGLTVEHRLHFDETRQQGRVFNLFGARSEYGKRGLVCIAETQAAADAQFVAARERLDRETS